MALDTKKVVAMCDGVTSLQRRFDAFEARRDAAETAPKNGDYGTKYDPEAVQKEINKDKRIKGPEASAIHRLLKGRH